LALLLMFGHIGAVEMGMGRMKCRFVRAVVETVQQQTAGGALTRLRGGLPAYLLGLLSRDVLGQIERDATIDFDAGIELLLAIDRVLCGGSGVVTSRATSALASRVLSQSSGLIVPGDSLATLQHLRAPFEQPFVEVDLRFHARRTPEGFLLELQLPAHPQGTRWLCSAGLGYAEAAATFSGNGSSRLRFHTELKGDRARVVGRQMSSGIMTVSGDPLRSREERQKALSTRRRPSGTNAVREVDEILSRASNAGTVLGPSLARARSGSYPGAAGEPKARAGSGLRPAASGPGRPRSRKSAV
jgi:hypothetical protein